MAIVLGFHAVVHKKQQRFSGWKDADLDVLLAGRGSGVGQQLKAFTRVTESAMIAAEPGKGGSNRGKMASFSKLNATSKAVRVEDTTAYSDRMLVCAGASTMLERLAVGGGAELVDESEEAGRGRNLSSAGDSATSTERLRLESQWTMSFSDSVDEELSRTRLGALREEKRVDGTSIDKRMEKKLVCSGKPKARRRRLEARKERLSNTEDRPPIGAFTIFPRRRADGKSDHKRAEGVQGYVSTYVREISKIDRLTHDEEVMLSKIIRIGYLLKEERKKLEGTMGHKLTKDQWAEHVNLKVADLDVKLHESELARDRMVMANLRLVLSVVKQYSCDGLEAADLIQEGTIGLLKGVEKFDHNRGYKLSTYVHWWIRQGVTRAIADHSRTVRLPVHVHDALGRIRRARARMLQDGDQATVENLGETLNLSSNQVTTALKVPKRLKSLDMQVGLQKSFLTGDSETFHSLVADRHAENQPWTMVERAQLKGDVERVLNTHLGSREREILKMHFGVESQDGSPMSLENISHRYGISRERVRQLERGAMQKLQSSRTGLDKYFGTLT